MKRQSRLTIFFTTVVAIFALIAVFAQDVQQNMTLGLDLQGGFEIVYQVSPLEDGDPLPSMAAITRSVSKRIDVLGVSEPQIIIEGDDRIRVQLAGVFDQEQARRIISSTANLTFRDVNDNLLADATILVEGGASLGFQDGKPVVSLKVADSEAFFDMTAKVAAYPPGSRWIVTWLDFEEGDSYQVELPKEPSGQQKYISAATVSTGIRGDAIISGRFNEATARELADLINSGSLPVRMNELSSNVISAEFGLAAYGRTMFAGFIGVLLVMAAMIGVYRLAGVVSAIMLSLYVFVVFLIYNGMGGVFTLPGIAALVLGVGMTVDANIITFERIKDQLYLGKRLEKAVQEGNNLAFWTIFDSQFTTFIAAMVMYLFGTGAIKGFATMLMVTVFVTLALNVFFTRYLINLLVQSPAFVEKFPLFKIKKEFVPDLSKGQEQTYFGPFTKIDFIKRSKIFIIASLSILLLGGIFAIGNAIGGNDALNLGIDFSSGTKITMISDDGFDVNQVRNEFAQFGYDNVRIQLSGDDTAYVTTKETESVENLTALKAYILAEYGHPANDVVVTPVIGRELVNTAVILSLVAWVLMMVYITFRFEWDYAIGTIVALIHDIAMVIAVFAIFRFEVNIELIAVILAIIGYSVDDSIVVFDRIRHTVKNWSKPVLTKKDYFAIVNESLQQTLFRTLFNTLTTVLPVVALITLGSREIFTFNIAMFIGLLAGAYSSIVIATMLWLWIRLNKKPKTRKAIKRKKDELEEMTIIGIND